MQMKTTAGPKRKYNSPSHPGMPPFKVIEIAAAAVSCAASGGLSLASGSWASSCATDARLGEVRHAEAPPAGVDRAKWDEFASRGSTLERGQSFSDGIKMASIGVAQSVQILGTWRERSGRGSKIFFLVI